MAYNQIKAALDALVGVPEEKRSKYLQTFQENEFTDDLVEVDPDSLKEVITVIGHRIKFLNAFKGSSGQLGSHDNSMNGFVRVEHARPLQQPSTPTIDFSRPQPIQIMDFKSKTGSDRSEIVFHKNIFRQILSKTWNKKIAILAITGPSRKGKSYFLNFILRYLNAKKTSNSDWIEKSDSSDRLVGFTWQNCTDRVTKGIWVWSELFTMKTELGEEFDLLIMDSQGVFDEHTTRREWSILVGLELLVSSCLIFNIVGDLQEDRLEDLELFLSFGLMAIEKQTSRPFQNLVFLIRDWNIPSSEHPYGSAGGQRYITTKLDTKNGIHKESHKRIRQQLKQCFENISCFLLPHPGGAVLAQNFNGLDTKSAEFTSEIEKCTVELVNSMRNCLKEINGNFLTGEDILNTFQLYCEVFNSDEIPNPQSLFDISVQNCNSVVIKKCLEAFEKDLTMHLSKRPFFLENDLLLIKESVERASLVSFELSRKMGSDVTIQKAKDQLIQNIEDSFGTFRERNTYNFNKAVSDAIDIAVKDYDEFMLDGLQNGFLSDEVFGSISLEGEGQACNIFAKSCGIGNINSLPNEVDKLQRLLRSKKEEFINKNALNRNEAVKDLEERIRQMVSKYKGTINKFTDGRIVLKEELEKYHDTQRERFMTEFNDLKINRFLVDDGRTNLTKQLNEEYERIYRETLNFNDKIALGSQSLITQVVASYRQAVQSNITLDRTNFDQLKNNSMNSAKKAVESSAPLQDPAFLENLIQNLVDEIHKLNPDLETVYEDKEKRFRAELRHEEEGAIDRYRGALSDLLDQYLETAVDPEVLTEFHAHERGNVQKNLIERCDKVCAAYGANLVAQDFENIKVQVLKEIENDFEKVRERNSFHIERIISQGLEMAISEYEQIMQRGIDRGFLSNEAIDVLSVEGERKSIDVFLSSCKICNRSLVSTTEGKLKGTLHSKKQHFVNQNALKKIDAVKEMKAKIESIAEDYKANMKSNTDGRVVPDESLKKFHQLGRKRASFKFGELQLHPELKDEGEAILYAAIDDHYKTVANFNQKVVGEGNSLVVKEALSYFDSVKAHMTLQRDNFLQLQNDFYELAQETIRISCPVQAEYFIEKLLQQLAEQIQKYNNDLEEIFRSRERELDVELRGWEDVAVEKYCAALNNLLTAGYVHPDDLERTHEKEKIKACEFLKTKIEESCAVFRAKIIPNVAVDTLLQLLLSKQQEFINKNLLNKREAEKVLEHKIQEIVCCYKKSMRDFAKGRIVPREDADKFHQTQRNKFLGDFDGMEGNPYLKDEGKVNLKRKIDDEYATIYNDIVNFNDRVMLESDSLITIAASNYSDCMKSNVTLNRIIFIERQNDSLQTAKETIITSAPLQDEEFLENLFQLLDDRIIKINLELEEIFERKQNELQTELHHEREKVAKGYSTALNQLLASNQFGMVPDALDTCQVNEKLKATDMLQKRFEEIRATTGADSDVFTSHMIQFEENLNEIYDSIKRQNTLKRENTEAQAHVILGQVKEVYVRLMKEAGDDITDENELRSVHDRIVNNSTDNLMSQLEALSLSPQLSAKLKDDLLSYTNDEFEGTLDVFRMKQKEDEDAVKNALSESRNYYNEEMEKHFQSKPWFEDSDMLELHNKIIETAIERGRSQVDLTDNQEKILRDVMNSSFKKYQEKNLLRKPTDSYAIGIDLGTTYSCVAVCVKGIVTVISQNEKTTVPSYVAFKDDHTVDVGKAAQDRAFRYPESTIFDAKRLIGRKFSEKIVQDDIKLWPFNVVGVQDQPRIKIPNHTETYRPEQVSARVLAHMKKMAEDYLKKTVTNAVITVPAYFTDSQRQATKDAAEISGLTAKILNEPTAAAIAYQLHRTDDWKRNILIFDLGGGTFDVGVLNVNGGDIVVKSIGGDPHLGGEDFDNEIVKHVIEVVKEKHEIDLGRGRDSSNSTERRNAYERIRRIKAECETKKRNLSYAESTDIAIECIDGTFNLDLKFTRDDFERLNIAKFRRCIELTKDVISKSKLEKSQIEDIVLVGGSTRIPKIRELLTEFFDGKALNSTINADESVSYGAAIQAALEYGKSDEVGAHITVADVTPIPLGIEIYGGGMSVIIPSNTPIPHSHGGVYYTTKDWQTSVDINVYEGVHPVAKENNHLGWFQLSGIPSALRAKEKLDVTMNIDREGILFVKAECRSTGGSENIKIETHKGRMSQIDKTLAMVGVGTSRW